ncbi:MAG: leucyl aminopeptidase [Pseudomonadota bacterium]
MQYFAASGAPNKQSHGCLVVGVYSKGRLTDAAQALDKASGGALSAVAKQGDLRDGVGATTMLRDLKGVAATRVLVVGLGASSKLDLVAWRKADLAAAKAVLATGSTSAVSYLGAEYPEARQADKATRLTVMNLESALYRFNELKSGSKPPAPKLKRFGFGVGSRAAANRAKAASAEGAAMAAGAAFCKDLANRPANVATPTHLADQAKAMAKKYKALSVQVLGEAQLRRLKMGSFLSVTAGSEEPAKMIVLKHQGAGAKDAPYALVGKGITFDSGGISIKPAPAMDEMKYDMGGAASVLGTFRAISELKLPINVVGILAACENMPSGKATKPGDVVTSMSGKTIEILNTDAEGRLILVDALHYVQRFKPKTVIDIATLTGACVIALGDQYSGLMSRDDDLAEQLADAGKRSGDGAWRLPVTDEYLPQLDSNFADLANVGGRPAGAITAGVFLSQFTQSLKWAHLDIAGTAWKGGAAKGATGRPVPLLTQYLMDRAEND